MSCSYCNWDFKKQTTKIHVHCCLWSLLSVIIFLKLYNQNIHPSRNILILLFVIFYFGNLTYKKLTCYMWACEGRVSEEKCICWAKLSKGDLFRMTERSPPLSHHLKCLKNLRNIFFWNTEYVESMSVIAWKQRQTFNFFNFNRN